MCSGARSSSAKIARSWRASSAIGMRDFEQHGAVALHDQGAVRHNRPVYAVRRRPDRGARQRGSDARRCSRAAACARCRRARSRARSRPPRERRRLEQVVDARGRPACRTRHGDGQLGPDGQLELPGQPGLRRSRSARRRAGRAASRDQAQRRRSAAPRRPRRGAARRRAIALAVGVLRDDRVARVGERPEQHVAASNRLTSRCRPTRREPERASAWSTASSRAGARSSDRT